ncbi:MAG: hypothetical protein ACQPRJ_03655 [Solitalea-like symbiont of Acarus siro]
MKTFFYKNFKFTLALLVTISLLTFTSCNNELSNKLDTRSTSSKDYLQLRTHGRIITDLFLDKDNPNYIDLSTGKLVTEHDHWDLKLDGMYASTLNANSGIKGRLNFIDEEYRNVDMGKVLEKFASNGDFNSNFTNLENFGMDHMVGDELGWARYDMSKHLIHPLTYRTLLLLTPSADNPDMNSLIKITITSMYKGNILFPTEEDKFNVPYLNARYEELHIL